MGSHATRANRVCARALNCRAARPARGCAALVKPSLKAATPFPRRVVTCAAEPVAASSIDKKKDQLRGMVGLGGGLDMPEEEKAKVVEFLKTFSEDGAAAPAKVDLAGTSWKLLFTESEGTSSGKFGPIVGSTGQQFPADMPGQYLNSVSLFRGFLKMELLGEYSAADDRKVELRFQKATAYLAGMQVLERPFPEDMIGFWSMVYADEDLRIFETNKGNIFALTKLA